VGAPSACLLGAVSEKLCKNPIRLREFSTSSRTKSLLLLLISEDPRPCTRSGAVLITVTRFAGNHGHLQTHIVRLVLHGHASHHERLHITLDHSPTASDTERRASWHLCTTHLCPHSLPCHITCIDLSPRLRHLPHHSQVLSWPLQHWVLHLTDVWDTAATHQPPCHHVTRAPCNSRFCT
jgi:hypothetical protein